MSPKSFRSSPIGSKRAYMDDQMDDSSRRDMDGWLIIKRKSLEVPESAINEGRSR